MLAFVLMEVNLSGTLETSGFKWGSCEMCFQLGSFR